jgi:hypothetical protein
MAEKKDYRTPGLRDDRTGALNGKAGLKWA